MPHRQPLRRALFATSWILLVGAALAQNTWYVDDGATPPGNGTLASPYASIQYALNQPATVSGDLVLVAPGTYTPFGFAGKAITVRATAGPLETFVVATDGACVGMIDERSVPTVEGFSLVGNSTPGGPGTEGVSLFSGWVRRCIIRGHRGGIHLTGFGVDAGGLTAGGLSQCTLVDNFIGAEGQPIGIFPVNSCVLYGNLHMDAVSIDPSYSLWGTGPAGFGTNVKGDARFWDLGSLDIHLKPGSPCIDTGSPSLPPDPDGSRADMGALPFSASYVPSVTTYCTGKINSQGCVAAIGASGGAGASMSSSSPFLVTCTGVVEGVPGLLFWGYAPRAVPFMGGFHCVQPPTPRTGGQLAGSSGSPCSGTYVFDFNAYAQSGLNPTLAAGQAIYAQYWYRDATLPPFFADTSDAIAFPLGP